MPLYGLPTILPDEFASTGIFSGGALSINADNTKFDIAAGTGYIADQTTTPVTLRPVRWDAFTAQTVTNLATQAATDIAINAAGEIVQQLSYTTEELRSLIFLGGLDHSGNTQINNVFSIQVPANGIGSSLSELARAIGDINISGNKFSANGANLRINKSAGSTFSYGRANVTDPRDPHTLTQAALTPATFTYVYSDGAGGSTFVGGQTDINPNQYDNGTGPLASLSGSQWSIQRLLMFSNTGNVFVQYGTETFTKLSDAINGLATTTFEALPGIRTAMVRGFLIVQRNETDLSTGATFVEADRFGRFVAGSGGAVGVAWGDIVGTLADQTDLQTALEDKITVQSGTNANGDWMICYGPDDNVLWRWFKVVSDTSATVTTFPDIPITMGTSDYVVWGNDEGVTESVFSIVAAVSANKTTTSFGFNVIRTDTGGRLARTGVTVYGFEFVVAA